MKRNKPVLIKGREYVPFGVNLIVTDFDTGNKYPLYIGDDANVVGYCSKENKILEGCFNLTESDSDSFVKHIGLILPPLSFKCTNVITE